MNYKLILIFLSFFSTRHKAPEQPIRPALAVKQLEANIHNLALENEKLNY